MSHTVTFCPNCATELQPITQLEDGGPKERLRCPACAWTHWNNPIPVLAAIIECTDRDGQGAQSDALAGASGAVNGQVAVDIRMEVDRVLLLGGRVVRDADDERFVGALPEQGQVVVPGQFVDCPVPLEGGEGDLGLERRRVELPFACHLPPFAGPPE